MLDASEVKNKLSLENTIDILMDLGSDYPKSASDDEVLIFNTVCHNISGGSHKLYYYHDRKTFTCYTECAETSDIYEIVRKNKALFGLKWGFYQTVQYVANMAGIRTRGSRKKGFGTNRFKINDWDFISRFNVRETIQTIYEPIPKGYLDCFNKLYHQSWVDDGISIETMEKFHIRYNIKDHQIVIPHYHGLTDELIGIRARNLTDEPLNKGQKYMPVYLQGEGFAHSLGGNLFGVSKNKEAIRKLKKVLIVESEKAVMQCETMYGELNFAVATCSSNITNMQRDMILELGVDEVILGFDKDFEVDSEDYKNKMKNICRLAKKFLPYVRVYVIEDEDNLLELKDSPTDKGQEVLEQLMKSKIGLTMEMAERIVKGDWFS